MLVKLFIKWLSLRAEPWKEQLKHKAEHVHSAGKMSTPWPSDINWLFEVVKPQINFYSSWKGIPGAWINIRGGINKADASSLAKILRQPIFESLQVLSSKDEPFRARNRNEERPLANKGITKLKHLWDAKTKAWKPMASLGLSKHPTSVLNRDKIIFMFPWNSNCTSTSLHLGDRVRPK
jgi:hypothetical protein